MSPRLPRRLGPGLFASLAVVALLGCAGEERRARRGGTFEEGSAPPRSSAPLPRWRHAADVPALTVVRPHQRSSHFVGWPDVELRVNEAAAAYGRARTPLGDAALIVASHALPEGVVRFVMEKRAGADPDHPKEVAWEYAVVDAEGNTLELGRIATCVRCHEEAPSDEVFGPPGL